MTIIDSLIEAARKKEAILEVRSRIKWEMFSSEDRRALFGKVTLLWDKEADTVYDLLKMMFSISNDNWYKMEVLYYAVQHPGCKGLELQQTLTSLEKYINKLEPANVRQTRLLNAAKAIFHNYTGQNYHLSGNNAAAIEHWEMAVKYFTDIEYYTWADNLKKKIANFKSSSVFIDKLSSSKSPNIQSNENEQVLLKNNRPGEDVNSLMEQKVLIQNQVDQNTKKLSSLQIEIQSVDLHRQNLLNECKLLANQLTSHKKDIEIIATEIEREKNNYQELSSSYQKLLAEYPQLEKINKQMLIDNENLKDIYANITNDISKSRRELAAIRTGIAQNQALQQDLPIKSNGEESTNTNDLAVALEKIQQLETELARYKNKRALPSFVTNIK